MVKSKFNYFFAAPVFIFVSMAGPAENYFIGIDIGGTKIAVSIANAEHNDCNIIDSSFVETCKNSDFTPTAERTFSAIDQLLLKHGIPHGKFSIGISCPGPLDTAAGDIVFVATTGWKNVPITKMFKERYKVPVYLENDCACAALAEACKGSGRGKKTVFYITVSTGVGSGICIDGNIFQGERGNAGEFGHICVEPDGLECQCGGKGCLQMYSSGTAMAKRFKNLAKEKKSMLSGKESITALDVETAFRRNDSAAMEVWNDAMEKLGMAAGIVYQLFDPGAIVFGGGVSNAWDLMESKLYSTIKNYVYEIDYPAIVEQHILRQAALGKYTGVTGAVMLAQKKRKEHE